MRTEKTLVFKVLEDNDYDYKKNVVEDIIAKSKTAKAELIGKLRKMPGWNEEAQAVIFDTDIIRHVDYDTVYEVMCWFEEKMKEGFEEIKTPFTRREVSNALSRLVDRKNAYVTLNNQLHQYYEELKICNDEIARFEEIWNYMETKTSTFGTKMISMEDYTNFQNFHTANRILYNFLKEGNTVLDGNMANEINELFPTISVANGLKVSKAYGRILKALKLNTIVDMQPKHNGELKDYGYNYQFARFGDAVNPIHVPRYVVLSVNFVDFLYMSNGNSWGSCHTIINGGAWGYRGEYSSGTISYALDPHSMIFYTVDKNYDGDEFCIEPKMQRVVFAYNKGVLYEGRVYPDGRDNGDQSYAGQFRSIVQKLFADVEDRANLWKKQTEKRDYIQNLYGTAYHDWECYSDTNISTLKEMETDGVKVNINAEPICIYCGRTHDCCENINCCDSGVVCNECGERGDEEDGWWLEGEFYCCQECVENAGYVWCSDVDQYVYRENCHEDCYTGEYFYRENEMVVTEDGNEYSSAEHAEDDGYMCDSDGYWWPADEVYYDEYEEIYFHVNDSDEVFEFSKGYYRSLENAKLNGEDVDDEEVIA